MSTSYIVLGIIIVLEGICMFALWLKRIEDRKDAYRRVHEIIKQISDMTHVLGDECPHCGFKHQPFPFTHLKKGDMVYIGWAAHTNKVMEITFHSNATWALLNGYGKKQIPTTCINR